jgi:hypothetical protein
VAHEVFRYARPAGIGEVGGGADDGPAQFGRQAHRHHALRDRLAETDACVVPPFQQIDLAVVERDIERHVGMRAPELRHQCLEHQRTQCARNSQPQGASRAVPKARQAREGVVDLAGRGQQVGVQRAARLGQHDPARIARQEDDAVLRFEQFHGLAGGGRCHADADGGGGKTLQLGDGQKDADGIQGSMFHRRDHELGVDSLSANCAYRQVIKAGTM